MSADVLDLTPPADDPGGERVPLFRVGDTTYDVPAKPALGVAVRFLTRAISGGGLVAELALLEDLLTPEGYQALLDQRISTENLKALISRCEEHALGPLERRPGLPSEPERSAG